MASQVEKLNQEMSYLIGFAHADGGLYESSRNRGKFSIELSKKDEEILYKFKSLIESLGYRAYLSSRKRDTNFKAGYLSSVLCVHNLSFRRMLKMYGVGLSKDVLSIPREVNVRHYLRGYIDGNGSLGYDKRGIPFISVTIISESLAQSYKNYVYEITGNRHDCGRNARDGVYNIVLYEASIIFLARKYLLYLKISEWVRPLGMKKRGARKFWVPEEDSYIQTHTLEESCSKLGRSEKSIKMRLFRLEHGLDYGHKPVLNIKAIDTKGASK